MFERILEMTFSFAARGWCYVKYDCFPPVNVIVFAVFCSGMAFF